MYITTKDGKQLSVKIDGNYYKEQYPNEFSELISFIENSTSNSIETAIKTAKKKEHIVKLRKWIDEVTIFLNEKGSKVKYVERIYCILNGITEIPKCKYCNENPVRFLGITTGYKRACRRKECRLKSAEETNLQKYGVKYYLSTKEAHKKAKRTWLQKYGVDNPMKVTEINEKAKSTIIQKYGGIGLQRKEVREKAKQTILEKYGVDNPMKSDIVRLKQKLSQQSEETKKKRAETVRKKYGVDNISQIPETRIKAYYTRIARRLGVKAEEWFNTQFWLDNFLENNGYINIKKAVDYFDVSVEAVRRNLWRLGLEEYRPTYSSLDEQYIAELISNMYNGEIIRNSKSIIPPFEIDVYLPQLKLGVEYDGTFWHSIGYELLGNYDEIRRRKWNKFHKYNKADKFGIRIFTIQQHLWEKKKDVYLSMLKSILGIQENRIGARQCIFKEISPEEAYSFHDKNHLNGGVYSKYNFGLFYDGKLVQVLSFSPYRFKQDNNTIEITRFSTLVNFNVIGGFSKLIENSSKILKMRGFTQIITFADRLISNGDVYLKCGFQFIGVTKPNYYYIDSDGNVYHRIQFQKHKLKEKLEIFDESLTEQENMILNGYRILYDAGHLKFVRNID